MNFQEIDRVRFYDSNGTPGHGIVKKEVISAYTKELIEIECFYFNLDGDKVFRRTVKEIAENK